jgi:chemotaxis protein CheD
MSTATCHVVPMGQLEVRKGSIIFTCTGLGSCLAVLAYDPGERIGGLANVMLPESFGSGEAPLARFASTAVPALIDHMTAAGADITRIQAAIVGGARMFRTAEANPSLDLGGRNRTIALLKLEELDVPCVAEDTGGDAARTVHLDCNSGLVVVRSTGGDKALCKLGGN